ncbi:MAG: prepilin-type N-terminal cleavage/methylation domain-containing protein, partial [Patescibacteria group bacterium]
MWGVLVPNNKRALTLIELLIAMAISIVVSGVILAILVSSWRADIAQTAYLDLQQKSRTAVDEISSTIKVSSGVVTSHTAGGTTYTTSSTELVLKTPAIDDSLNILTGTDYYVFRRNPITATILERIIVADPAS